MKTVKDIKILYSNGIISEEKNLPHFKFIVMDETTIFEGDEIISDIDRNLVNLHLSIQKLLFKNNSDYYTLFDGSTLWIHQLGIDSESTSSHDLLLKFINEAHDSETNKLLYMADIKFIISSLQIKIINSKNIFITFYKQLCALEPFTNLDDGDFFLTGEPAFNIYSLIENIFICFGSILDVLAKLIYELENIHEDFTAYPKLRSKDILYGDKKRLRLNKNDTLFSEDENIKLIINIRNEIIHNSGLEYNNKIYFKISEKIVKERTIYFPDYENGHIIKLKNRNRFFSQKNTVNSLLPELCLYFWKKFNNTLETIEKELLLKK